MADTWYGDEPEPEHSRLGFIGKLRALWRGAIILLILICGVVVFALSCIWRSSGPHHPSRRVVSAVCRSILFVLGLTICFVGDPLRRAGAMAANHSSWLDILVLNACAPVRFVSKSEVRQWPGIGLLARLTGTVFIKRDRQQSFRHVEAIQSELQAQNTLTIFPEGTSSDGRRVLPFKSTLFQALFDLPQMPDLQVQAVTVRYTAPEDADPRFYSWWGGMELGPHLMQVLAQKRQGKVDVTFHGARPLTDFPGRKQLARAMEEKVRSALG